MSTALPFGVLVFVLLVIGLYYWVKGLLEDRVQRQLRQDGTDTKAVVIGHQVLRLEQGRWTICYVQYRYYHQGQRYEKAERVSSERYNAWPRGTLIPVCYLPHHPQVVRITSEGNQFLPLGKVLIGAGLFFLAVAVVFLLTL